jgi:glycosyltransferase involved in cell wall biosynthesis/tetratricopeptide (TPR) repeat protein
VARADKYEPISTVIIGKNCASNLKECLASLQGFVLNHLGDEVVYLDTGSTDGGKTVRLAKKWGCRVVSRPDLSDSGMLELVKKYTPEHYELACKDPQFADGFLNDFAEARMVANEAAKNDLVFWIDTDDVLCGAKDLRALAHTFFSENKKALFLRYDYSFDQDDNACVTELWRERILRKSNYKWLGVCHETLIPKDMNPELAQRCPYQHIFVAHKNHRETKWSDIRNFAILMNAHDKAKEAGEWIDPRWEFYIGNACRGLEKYDEAIRWYSKTLLHSGSKEDRYTAAMNIAMIYMLRGRNWLALDWLWQAIKIFPTEPRTWFAMARCMHDNKRYEDAILFTNIGKQLPNPNLLTAVDPTGYDFYPDAFAAMSFRELKDYNNMVQCAESALRRRPDSKAAKELFDAARVEAINANVKQSIGVTLDHAASIDAAKEIVQHLKPEVRKGFRILQLERKRRRRPGTITYVTTETAEPWDGSSNADGIGGSEKMVMLLTREWAKAGRKVEVFGNPKDENLYKKIDGVQWKPIQAFNPASEYDTLVLWRMHGFLDLPLKARKIYMDLHDVQDPNDYLEARAMKCDGYLFKSQFHASPVVDQADPDRVIITRNGVDLSHFKSEEERDLQKIIYCSSGDRGLKKVLKIWARICEGLPNASLHLFYGFTSLYKTVAAQREYQHFGDEGCERHMLDYEEECYKLIDQLPRVTFHGRVSHEDLAKHLSTAGIWIYPTNFPEISCMAAMEAQIGGAVPIVFPTGALDETVLWGHKVKSDDGVIQAIRKVFDQGESLNEERKKWSAEAAERFDVTKLATEWLSLFDSE